MASISRKLFWLGPRLYARDLLSLGATLVAIVISALGKNKSIVLPLLCAFLMFTIWRFWITFKSRDAKIVLLAETAGGLFRFMNKTLFGDAHTTRFTLFQLSGGTLRPVARYFKGCTDVVQEAESSSCAYRIGEGITGSAWRSDGEQFDIQTLPPFERRRTLMDAYYIDTLKIPKDVVRNISDYMVDVRAILSYPLRDSHGKSLGLISIDIRDSELMIDEQDGTILIDPSPTAGGSSPSLVTHEALLQVAQVTANVVESIELCKRRVNYD